MKRTTYWIALAAAWVAWLGQPASAALVVHHPLDDATLPATYANQGVAGPVHDVHTVGSSAAVDAGKLGNGVRFTPSTGLTALNQTSTTAVPVSGDNARTVSVWANAAVLGNSQAPVSFGFNDSDPMSLGNTGKKFDLDMDRDPSPSTVVRLEVGVGGGRTDGQGQSSLVVNTWYLLTVTLPTSGNTGTRGLLTLSELDFFVNGQPVGSVGSTTKEIETQGDPLGASTHPVFAIGRGANNVTASRFNGIIDDVAIWDEDLTPGEVLGMFGVGDTTGYNAGQFNLLKQVHDAGAGSVAIGGLNWAYATGLSSTSLTAGGAVGDVLVLDAAAGTGLTAVPEPAGAALLAAGVVAMALGRRRGSI